MHHLQSNNNSFNTNTTYHNHCLANQIEQHHPGTMLPPSCIQDTFSTLPLQTQHQILTQILAANSSSADQQSKQNSNQQQQQQQNQNISSANPLPSLPLAPPPSLASALYAQQQYQQQQQLLDDFIHNTLARGHNTHHIPQQQASPVQYNSPWNVNLDSANQNNHTALHRLATSNITKNSPKHNLPHLSSEQSNLLSSTFTAQQYANRSLNNKQLHLSLQLQQQTQPPQQDYSSISPVDEISSEFNFAHQLQLQQQQFNQQQYQILNSNLFSPSKNAEMLPQTWVMQID